MVGAKEDDFRTLHAWVWFGILFLKNNFIIFKIIKKIEKPLMIKICIYILWKLRTFPFSLFPFPLMTKCNPSPNAWCYLKKAFKISTLRNHEERTQQEHAIKAWLSQKLHSYIWVCGWRTLKMCLLFNT